MKSLWKELDHLLALLVIWAWTQQVDYCLHTRHISKNGDNLLLAGCQSEWQSLTKNGSCDFLHFLVQRKISLDRIQSIWNANSKSFSDASLTVWFLALFRYAMWNKTFTHLYIAPGIIANDDQPVTPVAPNWCSMVMRCLQILNSCIDISYLIVN